MSGKRDAKSRIILSFDPGSKFLGWAITIPGQGRHKPRVLKSGLIKPSPAKRSVNGSDFKKLLKECRGLMKENSVTDCAIESYTSFRRTVGAGIVPKIIAILQLAWFQHSNKEADFMSPVHWKQQIVSGKLDKKSVELQLIKSGYAPRGLKDDEYDAIGIGIAWHTVFGGAPKLAVSSIQTKNIRKKRKKK